MIWNWKSMKVVGEDGSKFELGKGGKALFGRWSGYNTDDRTVSRHHVSFEVTNSLGKSGIRTEPRVLFEVIGRNPIWVWSKKNGAIRVFRKFEKGELEAGDRFCLSGKATLWFILKQSEVQEEEKRVLESENEAAESSQGGLDFEDMDVSAIDPIKEFGFIAMGHEFDHCPNGMIRNVKNWEWFLEEPSKDSEDEEEFEKKERRGMRGKRKKGKDNEDDEWTGESEDDKDLVAKARKAKKPDYTTRSKDIEGPTKDTKGSQNSRRKKATGVEETLEDEDEDEDEDDETLGGFIVDDEEEEQEEEKYEDEEGEFEEDDDEMEE